MAKKPVVPIPITTLGVLVPALREGEAVRPVPGSSRHFVTDLGFILEVKRQTVIRGVGTAQTHKYRQAWITRDDGTVYRPLIHGLVMEVFVGPRPVDEFGEPFHVHHVDGDIKHNALANLQYLTAHHHRDITRLGNQGPSKLQSVDIWIARCEAYSGSLAAAVARLVETRGVVKATAFAAIKGRSWKAVPLPTDPVSAVDLARVLGVSVGRAAELLDLARPSSGRQAA